MTQTPTIERLPVRRDDAEDLPFLVTALGSCRVASPLRRADTNAPFRLNQSGVYGYCHSSAEVLQQLQVMQGHRVLPDSLYPLVAPSVDDQRRACMFHKPSDLYFIELCSAKVLRVGEHVVQLNYMTRAYEDFFSDRDRARQFWRHARLSPNAELQAWLKTEQAFQKLQPDAQDLLSATALGMASPESLRHDISEILKLVPDAVFVTHFNATKHDGTYLKARSDYITMVSRVLRDLGATVFDPTDYVSAFGQIDALEDAARSLSHYAPEFEDVLCENWIRRYIAPRAALAETGGSEPTEAVPLRAAMAG